MSDLEKALRPEDGWWKSDTAKAIRYAEAMLRAHNVPGEDIEKAVGRVVDAMRGEYGE